MKTERMQIRFLSDALVAVASLDLKVLTNLEQTLLNRSQQLPAPYKRLKIGRAHV